MDFTSFDQIGTGTLAITEKETNELRWWDYYLGKLEGLFEGLNGREHNGISIVAGLRKEYVQMFKHLSLFYQDMLLSERPAISSTNESRQEWIEEYKDNIFEALDDAIESWSVLGKGILMTQADGSIRGIKNFNYYPIKAAYDEKITLGHCFIYTYPEYPTDQMKTRTNFPPNRARVVKYSNVPGFEINTIETYGFTGTQIQAPLGKNTLTKLIDTQNSLVTSVSVIGKDSGTFYPDVEPHIRELILRETIDTRRLNSHSFPNLVAPATSGLVGPDGRLLRPFPDTGSVLEADEGESYSYLTPELEVAATHAKIQRIINYIHLTSRVPPIIFGLDIGKGESGAAREKLLQGPDGIIRRVRREIENVLNEVFDAMGAPEGDTKIKWVADPFANVEARETLWLNRFDTGALEKNELRTEAWDMEPLEKFDEEEIPNEESENNQQERINNFMEDMNNGSN